MPSVNLTDRFVASVRGTRRENYFDMKVKGLTLRVTPTGAKTWAFVYRLNGRPSQWLAMGTYPSVALTDARKMALDHRRAVDVDGRDPAAENRIEREAARRPARTVPAVYTFADLATLYLTFAKGRKKTWADDAQKISKYLVPAWGPLPLRDITRAHVHELLDRLVAQGMTVGVNRVQAVISRLFTVALDRSLVDAHPAARMMKRFKERAGERVLSDDEIRALSAGLDAHPGRAADALRLRLLLGQRGEEVAGIEWAEVDFSTGIWEMPGKRTKNGRPHAVPLGPTAKAILERRRAEVPETEARVFPGLTLRSDDYRVLAVIHAGRYEWKDLRRTLATRLAGLGFDESTIGRVLNHARHTVTAKHYNKHAYLSEKRAALEAWDATLQAILQGKPTSVLAFSKRA